MLTQNIINTIRKFIFPLALIQLLALFSCKKLIEVNQPINQITSQTIFQNDGSATSAVVGLYSQIINLNLSFGSGAMTIFPGLSADEIYNTAPNSSYDPFLSNSLDPSNSTVQYNFWQLGYNYIYQANAIMEGLTASTGVSVGTKNQLIGEAKFMRAFCYFYLTNLFGDVPLETNTSYQTNAVQARTLSANVYQQMITDLKDAENLMSTDYPTSGKGRPNSWAATALLSRVYLYQGDWVDAESAAGSVIASGAYSLQTDLTQVFLANSPEAIWQLVPGGTGEVNTWDAYWFIPSPGLAPNFALTSLLQNAFEPGDQRFVSWLDSISLSGTTYYYPYKYKVVNGTSITEYYTMLRFAEQYLIRAEARAEQNNISGSQADLDSIRNRAGLGNTSASDQASLLLAVEHERQVELFAEWGHRWLDLKRTGRANAVLGAEKPGWKSTAALYPIPFSEIQANPALTQNSGY
jgi:starch-binding outer membrane protein, SusD/RagB family